METFLLFECDRFSQEIHEVSASDVIAGYFTLRFEPSNAGSVWIHILGGIRQINKQVVGSTEGTPDFDVLRTNQVHINNNDLATGLSETIVRGDRLLIRSYYD